MWTPLAEAIKNLPSQNNPDTKPATISGMDYKNTTHAHIYEQTGGKFLRVRCISKQPACLAILATKNA